MSLEQQINYVWNSSRVNCCHNIDNCINWHPRYAKMEFKKQFPQYSDWSKKIWLDNIKKTKQLVKQNLVIALTSPSEYIREYARLITEEIKNGNS